MQCTKCGVYHVSHLNYCSGCGRQLGEPLHVVFTGYTGFWKRFGALIIDSILLSIVSSICFTIMIVVLGGAMAFSFNMSSLASLSYGITMIVAIFMFGTILNWLYYTLMESSPQQATLGKMALGIVVIDEFGGRISFARANGRYWSKILSGMFLWIGYLMAAFTEKKQALHDLIATTFVVDK